MIAAVTSMMKCDIEMKCVWQAEWVMRGKPLSVPPLGIALSRFRGGLNENIFSAENNFLFRLFWSTWTACSFFLFCSKILLVFKPTKIIPLRRRNKKTENILRRLSLLLQPSIFTPNLAVRTHTHSLSSSCIVANLWKCFLNEKPLVEAGSSHWFCRQQPQHQQQHRRQLSN